MKPETGNASEAYRRAYKAGRMKTAAVHVSASRLLDNAKVALKVAELRAATVEKGVMSAAEALLEASRLARFSIQAERSRPQSSTPGHGRPLENGKITVRFSDLGADGEITGRVAELRRRISHRRAGNSRCPTLALFRRRRGWRFPEQIG